MLNVLWKNLPAATKASHQMQIHLVFVHVHQLNDVGVADLAENLHLPQQALYPRDSCLADGLDGILISRLEVHASPHNTVVPPAQRFHLLGNSWGTKWRAVIRLGYDTNTLWLCCTVAAACVRGADLLTCKSAPMSERRRSEHS